MNHILSMNANRKFGAASAADESYSCEFGSTKYFALCGIGGILSCGITHTMVTPLDLVKCRLQVRTIWQTKMPKELTTVDLG